MKPSLFTRTPDPIIVPSMDLPWAAGAVFNPGAWRDGDVVHLLFRAIPGGHRRILLDGPGTGETAFGFDPYVSAIGYASSTDGVRFECRSVPFISPDTPIDHFGAEDARVSKIDDTYFITYTALSEPAFGPKRAWHIGLATTEDFIGLRKHGAIGPPVASKDTVIFPRRIRGRIVMLHRIIPDIQLISFDDVCQLMSPSESVWRSHLDTLPEHVVMRPRVGWESKKIGAGPTPIETEEGWLLIYHGVDEHYVYRVGLALLDLDDPQRVISRTMTPVMEPETDYECVGDVNNVVFPQGAVVIDGTLHLYYGAADRVIGHATAPLSGLVDHLRSGAGNE
jgi:predicted GH43/DUF377 family glycosyl hydrolase